MKTYTTLISVLTAALLCFLNTHSTLADDTEVYLDQISLPAQQIRPNVVFILDSSGSMGLPVQGYGASRYQEDDNYDSNTTYTGSINTSGGPGDSDYYYLYRKPNTYADQYVYYNKVHTDQMTCNMSTVNDSTPYTTSRDEYIFNDGTPNWGHMCDENNSNCSFTPGPSGPLVDCDNEQNHITSNSAYNNATRLYVVSANYHNYLQSYYRYSVLQTVVKDIIDTPFDINMSIMKFNGGSGGIMIKESVDATQPSNQADLKTVVNNIHFDGTTPLTESLWEASRYLRGETATYGSSGVSEVFSSGTTYDSPIDYACQKNHIILLTDGNAYSDGGRDSDISTLTGSNCSHRNNADAANESCLDNYAGWLATDSDNDPSLRRDHSGITGDQTISVHTIGFGLDNPLLAATATNGQGLNRTASTAQQLADAFSTILDQAEFEKDTFVAPAVAVNAYNGLQHRDELYFALFQPAASPRWSGNIKKYKLNGAVIEDQNGNAAIDPTTGYFVDSALSYWTSPTDLDNDGTVDFTTDGGEISLGGFATELTDPTARTIYTYTSTSTPSDVLLTEMLDTANTAITNTMLGNDVTADERTEIINWSRGGVTNSPPPNYFMADFIHNRPSVVTYQTTKTLNQDGSVASVSFDDTIYAASNMGFFHAIDADNGNEVFSFVPKEMFNVLTTYYRNSGSFHDKVYGLDSPMTVWRYDEDNDGNIVNNNGTVDGNDFVHIFQAQRRGGTLLYALDVTLRNSPKLMWQINGTAYSTASGDFRNLADTWSVPQRGKIKWNCNAGTCTDKNVLFFGGGYDIAYDDKSNSPATTNRGNALYMVDATTGALLWSAGNGSHHDVNISTMTSSIPADVTTGDIDGDGYIDFLFAIDIRGGLWRVDVADEPTSAATFATAGMIANLNQSVGTGENFRRFYNAPDVAFFAQRGSTPFLSISVASGYRAHPRNTDVSDYLFVVFDNNALTPPTNNYNYVGGTSIISDANLGVTPLSTVYGWKKPFTTTGEKGLSRTITFGNQIIMTTYTPQTSSTCQGSTGTGRRYLLDALTGDNLVPYVDLQHGGIPPEPAVIYSTEDVCIANCDGTGTEVLEKRPNLVVCVGTECIDDVVDQKLHRMFWREN